MGLHLFNCGAFKVTERAADLAFDMLYKHMGAHIIF
jgi:hypothetical protein